MIDFDGADRSPAGVPPAAASPAAGGSAVDVIVRP